MPKIICTITAGCRSNTQIVAAEAALRASYAQHVDPAAKPLVLWCGLPVGQCFVEGKPSDAFILLVEVPDGMAQAAREVALLAFRDTFSQAMEIEVTTPLISALDAEKVNAYLLANRQRLRAWRRPGFMIATLLHALRTRRQHGFAALRANL